MASAFDNSVAAGRTGVITNTTAYGILAAGTTATGAQQCISPGTSGQVLTSNGASALPSFQTGGGTGVTVLLGSATASTSAILEFTSIFSSSYDQYIIEFNNVLPATNNVTLYSQLGTGAGPTYITANYGWQVNVFVNGSNAFVGNGSDAQALITTNNATYGISNASIGVGGSLWINGPNGSSNPAQGVGNVVYLSASGTQVGSTYTSWQQPAAIFTAIKFYMSSGNITSGTIRIYGLKNT